MMKRTIIKKKVYQSPSWKVYDLPERPQLLIVSGKGGFKGDPETEELPE